MKAFLQLTLEAIRDAARRRIVAVVLVLSFLSILGIDGCTSCAGRVSVNGELRTLEELAGITGALTFMTLSFWCIVLAGVLAAEHLAQTLSDGSANLTLARPVGRTTFALSRLAGALAIAGAMTVVLLGVAAFLLNARGGLALGPPLLAAACVGLGAIIVGALSMTASLWLPRVACMLLSVFFMAAIGMANLVGLAGEPSGMLWALDELGPPIVRTLALALDSWVPELGAGALAASDWARLLGWTAGSLALLGFAFKRIELGR